MAETVNQEGLPTREPIHAAAMLPGSERVLGPTSNQAVFLAMAGAMVLVFVVGAVVTFLKIRISLAWILPIVFLFFGGLIALAVRMIRSPWKWNRNGSFSDPAFRLRIVGDGASTEAVLADLLTDSFEPVIIRSIGGVVLAKSLPPMQVENAPDGEFRDHAAWEFEQRSSKEFQTVVLAIVFGVCLVMLHRRIFGVWSGISVPHFFGAAGLAMLFRAFVRPEYIRIAPGVLDVFRYGVLGIGKPKLERFDLRTASITLDLTSGAARIHDPSRPEFPVLYLALRSLLAWPRTTAGAVFSGARSIGETPPLPTDALVG